MSCRRLALLLLLLVEFGCQKKVAGPPPRYAVLRFENLSGDPSLDWIGRAASQALPVMLQGALDGPVLPSSSVTHFAAPLGARPPAAPGDSAERTDAIAAGAMRTITGYVERVGGKIRITAVVSNLRTGRTERITSAEGTSGLNAIDQLARSLAGGRTTAPYMTTDSDALRLFATGLESQHQTALDDMQQAVRADPNFGPPWLALERLYALQHDREGATKTILQAKAEKLDPLTRANLDLDAAALDGSNEGKLAALRRISTLAPSDTVLLQSLADSETAAGNFAAAAADWKKLIDAQPEDTVLWNNVAYDRAYGGDFTGALAAIAEYTRLRPNDPNTLDSSGDIHYLERKFGEAAKLYLDAWTKDPNFLSGGDLYKAAWAKFEAGDKSGADETFDKLRIAREKARDPVLPLREADWLYRTGHADQAIAMMRSRLKDPKAGAMRMSAAAQLAVWDLLRDDRARAMEDAAAAGPPTTGAALIARFAAMPSASAAEWNARADRLFSNPALAGPKRLALGYALLLDNKRAEALPIWQQIAAAAPATDFFVHAVATRLEGKPLKEPLVPDAANVNEFAALLDKL